MLKSKRNKVLIRTYQNFTFLMVKDPLDQSKCSYFHERDKMFQIQKYTDFSSWKVYMFEPRNLKVGLETLFRMNEWNIVRQNTLTRRR